MQPLIDKLLASETQKSIEEKCKQILSNLRETRLRSPGYAAGNILNLLCLLNIDLADYDFSHLTVWQAYLSARSLQRVNFAHCDLAKSVFTEDLSITLSVAFSPDGTLATGDADGKIRVWQVSDGKKLFSCKGHTNWIW